MLTASHATRRQVASAAEPIIHQRAPRTVLGSARASATMIAAFANAPTTTPAMSRVRTSARVPRPPTRATASVRNTAPIPPTNAARVITASPETPNANATTAPTAAPPETPRRYGSANGLRRAPWSAAPLAPSPAPTSAPSTTRGSRRSRTIAIAVASPRPLSASITPASDTETAPRATAIIATTSKAAMRPTQYQLRNRIIGIAPGEPHCRIASVDRAWMKQVSQRHRCFPESDSGSPHEHGIHLQNLPFPHGPDDPPPAVFADLLN